MKMREISRAVDKKLQVNNYWLDESRLLKTDIINSIFKPFLNVVRSPGFLKKPEYADKKEKYLEENKEYTFTINPLNFEIRTIYGGGEKCIINPKQAFFIDLRFKHQYSNEVETIPLYAVVDDSVNAIYNGYEIIKAGDFSVETIDDTNWWV